MTGRGSVHWGLAAEEAVAQDYASRAFHCAARRWRGSRGEIDLVMDDTDGGLVFVEVKKARSLVQAATRLSMAQLRRIQKTALEYLAAAGLGQSTEMRFDLALVDELGRIEVIENVTV